MPSKDLLPGLHQMIAAAFLKNHMPLARYQWRNIFRPGSTLQRPAQDICSFHLLQKTLFLMGRATNSPARSNRSFDWVRNR